MGARSRRRSFISFVERTREGEEGDDIQMKESLESGVAVDLVF